MNRSKKMSKNSNVHNLELLKRMEELVSAYLVYRLERRFLSDDFNFLFATLFVDSVRIFEAIESLTLDELCDPQVLANLENDLYLEVQTSVVKLLNQRGKIYE